jgi:hypothetical protein
VQLVAEVALALLRDYSPPRPVRLLGVRVAGLGTTTVPAKGDDAGDVGGGGVQDARSPGGGGGPTDQLALPV